MVNIAGAAIPPSKEFRSLGVGIRLAGKPGTGPLLGQRMGRAGELLSRVHGVQGGRARKAEAVATLVLAVGLFGAGLADAAPTDLRALETKVLTAVWGSQRGGRAKEVVFAVLMKGHRLSPVMKVDYMLVSWLVRTARRPGSLQTVVQAVWEATGGRPPPTGPVGRVFRTMWGLGWKPLEGWWSWQLPDEVEPFDMVHDPEQELKHRLREALRGQQLRNLEQRRPRQFEGMRGEVLKDVLNDALAKHADALERTLLMGALAGATLTAERAFRRGLRKQPECP